MGQILVIGGAIDQAALACTAVAVTEDKDRRYPEYDGQPDQDAKQFQVAEAGQGRKGLGHISDQRTAHQFQPVGDGDGKPDRPQPDGQHFQRVDGAAEDEQDAADPLGQETGVTNDQQADGTPEPAPSWPA